ncbi:MAG: efflux RND transporter periplasmic adaptor subunit [Haliscomenobacter sp.]|nr:efflux RND transporter periplasmic adaptor subunit [Haliscomenobacter sp.]MBP9076901.1 efflux RND transporter periplasmic adaptor subunit [Haliscomenobacter sp.]
MKRYVALLACVAAVAMACQSKSKQESPAAAPEEVIPVRIAQAEERVLVFPVVASGILTSGQEAKPGFKTGGVIKRTFVEEGDRVFKGQLLATLHMAEINAQAQQAEEGLAKAKRDLQRAKNLYADSVATLEQVQNASTAVRLAEESIQIARFNQQYSEVRSPVNGKVIRKLLSEGEVAGPGMPVFFLLGNESGDWTIQAGLSDRDWARLKPGNLAEIAFDAFPGQVFQGRVKRLADVVNPQSGTFDAEVELLTRPPKLASGLAASLRISPEKAGSSVVIPIDALMESQNGSGAVYVINPDGQTAARRTVRIGPLYGDWVVVQEGLTPGEQVATTGGLFLEDGRKIKIIQ